MKEIPLDWGVNDIDLYGSEIHWRENPSVRIRTTFHQKGKIIVLPYQMEAGVPGRFSNFSVCTEGVGKIIWGIVPIGDSNAIADNPDDGEATIQSVRFVNAKLRDVLTSLVIVSHRIIGDSGYYQPSTVDISIFALDGGIEEVLQDKTLIFVSSPRFVLLTKFQTISKYGDADTALYNELGLPLPDPDNARSWGDD